MKKPKRSRATFCVLKPRSCPYERFAFESDRNNAYLQRITGTESDNK
jgi:hypothetical protein